MISDKEITVEYIQKHGISTSNIIVNIITGELRQVLLEKFEVVEREHPLKIGEDISYVHLFGVHLDDILPIGIIERGVIYVTTHVFYQIEEKEGRKDMKLYIPI